MLISHRQEDIGDFNLSNLEMTPECRSRSKVNALLLIGQ